MAGSGQAAVAGRVPDHHIAHRARDPLVEPHRQLRQPLQLRPRAAEHRFRLEHLAAPDRDRGLQPRVGGVDREIAARVARADRQDARALDLVHRAVGARVDLLAGELAGIRRQVLIPQVPVTDEHARVLAGRTVGGLDLPSVTAGGAERRDPLHAHAQAHVGAHAGLGGEALQVAAHLVTARIDRIARRHRIAGEAREVPGGDQVQGLVVGVPVAADALALLEAVERDPVPLEHLHRTQAGRAGADDTNLHRAKDGARSADRPLPIRDVRYRRWL